MMKLNMILVAAAFVFAAPFALACEDHGTQSSTTQSAKEHTCDGSCMHDGKKCDHGDGKTCQEGGCEHCAKHADGKKHECPHCSGKGHAHDKKVDKTTQEKSEFRQKIDTQLDQIETQIAELKTKSSAMSADAKAGMETRIAKLEKSRDEIKADLDKMSDSSGRAWTKFKKGVSKAVDNLEAGFKEAKTELDKKTKN